ncbi:hypothetical protein D3C71_1726150 [compost metagenome]
MLRVRLIDVGWQRGEETGKAFTLGDGTGILETEDVNDLGVVIRAAIVDLPHHIRNRQNPRLGPRQHVIHMADFLPLENRALRHRRIPVLQQRGAMHCIERRYVLPHVVENTILRTLGVVVLLHLLVTAIVLHEVGVREVHQAIAMAHAVIGVGFQKID